MSESRGGAVQRTGTRATTLVLLAAVIGGVTFVVSDLTSQPTTVDCTSSPGQPVEVVMETLGAYGHDIHAPWVSVHDPAARRPVVARPRSGRHTRRST